MPSPAGTPSALPHVGTLSAGSRIIEALSLGLAIALLSANLARLTEAPTALIPLLPVIFAIALVAADFATGLVHWAADTWGRESLPIVGPRFLRPFRVHHVNPDDLARRDFLDCNGDVAMGTLPMFGAAMLVPVDTLPASIGASFLVALAAFVLPTNQVHQWAHRTTVPRPVAWLHRHGLILGRDGHARHHHPPYAAHYCILTGWCNRPLAALNFFPHLERVITAVTGARPRDDDRTFMAVAGTDT